MLIQIVKKDYLSKGKIVIEAEVLGKHAVYFKHNIITFIFI